MRFQFEKPDRKIDGLHTAQNSWLWRDMCLTPRDSVTANTRRRRRRRRSCNINFASILPYMLRLLRAGKLFQLKIVNIAKFSSNISLALFIFNLFREIPCISILRRSELGRVTLLNYPFLRITQVTISRRASISRSASVTHSVSVAVLPKSQETAFYLCNPSISLLLSVFETFSLPFF